MRAMWLPMELSLPMVLTVAVGVFLSKNWEEVTAAVKGFFESIWNAIKGFFD